MATAGRLHSLRRHSSILIDGAAACQSADNAKWCKPTLGCPGQRDDGDVEGERGQLQGIKGCFCGSPPGSGRSRVPRNLPRTLHQASQTGSSPLPFVSGVQRVQGLLQFQAAHRSCHLTCQVAEWHAATLHCFLLLKCASTVATKLFLPQLAGFHLDLFAPQQKISRYYKCRLKLSQTSPALTLTYVLERPKKKQLILGLFPFYCS